MKILISIDWFVPGYKAGGPIRSCVNLAQALQNNYHVFVLTSNQDFGSQEPYPEIEPDTWLDYQDSIKICYLSPQNRTYSAIKEKFLEVDPDFVYLNSMFSVVYTLFPLWLKWREKLGAKVILAPRGMLHKGALQYKSFKKRLYLFYTRLLGLYKNILFHATDEEEGKNIKEHLRSPEKNIIMASNLPTIFHGDWACRKKEKGQLNGIFISRISPKKNLLFLLDALKKIKPNFIVHLSIVGPVEDLSYWENCKARIKEFGPSIKVTYIGEKPFPEIEGLLKKNHFFFLPTYGENFGHAIFEAFASGLPVIISDQTPWRNLEEKNVGWDIPLDQPNQFVKAIERAIQMDQEEYNQWSKAAWQFAQDYVANSNLKQKYLELFSPPLPPSPKGVSTRI